MFNDNITIRPRINFKFGKYDWRTDKFYTIHRSFAELFASNNWLIKNSRGSIDLGIVKDSSLIPRDTLEDFQDFFDIVIQTQIIRKEIPNAMSPALLLDVEPVKLTFHPKPK